MPLYTSPLASIFAIYINDLPKIAYLTAFRALPSKNKHLTPVRLMLKELCVTAWAYSRSIRLGS